MARSVETAKALAGDRPLVLVLGDMRELGVRAGAEHERLGASLRRHRPAAVLFQGDHAADVGRGFGANGSAGRYLPVPGPEAAAEVLAALKLEPGVVLVKGSRSCRMERYAKALLDGLCAPGEAGNDAGNGAERGRA
jgi:UDP-N-acetylmuramoyl-tripeptide--D-alanyl-D-alanine ligase